MRSLVLVALAGCSQVLGIGDLKGGSDAQPGSDAAPTDGVVSDVAVGGHIKLTGKVLYSDGQAQQTIAGVPLGFHRLPDDVIVGQATSEQNGAYTIDIATNMAPVLGYLHVGTLAVLNAHDTYIYLPHAMTADTAVDALLISGNALQVLANQAGTNYNANSTVAFFSTVTPANMPLANATVSLSVAGIAVRYFNEAGQINPTLTATSSSAAAVVFNLSQIDVTFTGKLNNVPFATREINIAGPETLYVGLGQP